MALSGRGERLQIQELVSLSELQIPKKDLAIIAYEGAKKSLKDIVREHPKPGSVWLFIGSEGGFSSRELEDFMTKNQAFPFTLGGQILRVKTACLFGLSLLKYHYHL